VASSLEERDGDVHVGERLDEVRVEGGGLVLVADEKRARAEAGGDGRLAFRAAGGERGEEREDET
jgi:hypothetical protein